MLFDPWEIVGVAGVLLAIMMLPVVLAWRIGWAGGVLTYDMIMALRGREG